MQVPHQKRSEIHHHVTSPPAYQHVREAFQCGRLAADLLGSGPRLPQPSLDPARASPPVEQSTRQSQDNRKTTTRQSTRQFKTLHNMDISLLAGLKKKNNIILYIFLMRTTKCPFCVLLLQHQQQDSKLLLPSNSALPCSSRGLTLGQDRDLEISCEVALSGGLCQISRHCFE